MVFNVNSSTIKQFMLNRSCQSLGVKLKTVFVPNLNNLNSFLKAIIDSKNANWKFRESQFNIGYKNICYALYDYSQHNFWLISNPSKTLTPKCYSPKYQLPEQTKQDKTLPVLHTVAWLHSTEPQTTPKNIMINTAKQDYPQPRWTQV